MWSNLDRDLKQNASLSLKETFNSENKLNTAILSGNHIKVTELLNNGAKSDADTITCALFSGLPHFTVKKLLDTEADTTLAKAHVEYSSLHDPLRTQIKGEPITNLAVSPQQALDYAKLRLGGFIKRYGFFEGLEAEIKQAKSDSNLTNRIKTTTNFTYHLDILITERQKAGLLQKNELNEESPNPARQNNFDF